MEQDPTSPGRVPPPRGPLPPQVLEALRPRYEVQQEVARGGMGAVYRAIQKPLGRPVAIKVVLPGASPRRFLREAQILAGFSSPHVVTVHDFELLPDGTPVLVMEWIEGRSLAQLMRSSGGLLDERAALPLMRDTAAGMLAAAEQGVVHRDLKPSNILVDAQGRAKVADFGLARSARSEAGLSLAGELMGTPFYMAPEQWEDPRRVDTRTDVYSFGATWYHALTGRAPFEGQTPVAVLFSHKTEPLVSPRTRNPAVSERVSDLIERCLAKSPEDRFPGFAEVGRQLQAGGDAPRPWDEGDDDPELATHMARYGSRREAYLLRLMTESEVDVYEFPGQRRLLLRRGDIVEQAVEAIVSSDDGSLTMSGGVSHRIRKAAGPLLVEQARRLAPVRAGRAIVTTGGQLRQRYVIHAITLEFSRDQALKPSRDLISELMSSCVYQADSHYVTTIAFPLLGTGTAGLPEDVCLDTMFRFLARLFTQRLTALREATIVLY